MEQGFQGQPMLSLAGPGTLALSFWRFRGPAAKAEGKKATGFAHAMLLGKKPPMVCSPKVQQGWFFQAPWKYKKLQAPWNASWRQSSIRRWWLNLFRSSRRSWKPASIRILPRCFGLWSAVSGLYHGVARQNVGPINHRGRYWQRRRPCSFQQCRSCGAVLALVQNCTSRHQAPQLLPPASLPFVGSKAHWLWCSGGTASSSAASKSISFSSHEWQWSLSLSNFNFEIDSAF